MNSPAEPRRIRGALAFLAELEAVAVEFAENTEWDDELTIRRRSREEARPLETTIAEAEVKAL